VGPAEAGQIGYDGDPVQVMAEILTFIRMTMVGEDPDFRQDDTGSSG